MHGGLSSAQKDEQIPRFEEETAILVATEIGGDGRNLQFCHRMVNYDLPWDPMKIEQRVGRIHRLGQQNEVLNSVSRTFGQGCGSAGWASDQIQHIAAGMKEAFSFVVPQEIAAFQESMSRKFRRDSLLTQD